MEPEEILERLEDAEEDREALAQAMIAALLLAYRAELDALGNALERAAGSESTLDSVLTARARTLRADAGFRGVWEQWRDGLVPLSRAVRRSVTPEGRTPAESEGLKDLRTGISGRWPSRDMDGTGLGGRLFALSLRDRTELSDIVSRGLLLGADKEALVSELARRIERSLHDAERLFHDGTYQYLRRAVDQQAQERGLDLFYYAGPADSKNRPFCRSLISQGRVFSREEINTMDNGQTPVGTVMYACGGFRCRHIFRPTSPDWGIDEILRGRLG